jgi:predicted nuclease of predicted toxin-antitoxin system
MQLLLDECLPRALKKEFHGHKIRIVPEMGWAGKKNGELLELAEKQFDVFITLDQNLQYQQNLRKSSMAVLLLSVKNNRFESIQPLVSKVFFALKSLQPGQTVKISG